jgi:hypothetical protein
MSNVFYKFRSHRSSEDLARTLSIITDRQIYAPSLKKLNLKRKMEIWSSRAKYCNYGEWMPQSRRFLFTQKVS